MIDYKNAYQVWKDALKETEYEKELLPLEQDDKQMQESFYQEMEFGTAGMRGILGMGTNRMNDFTVRRLTKGLADYLNEKGAAAEGVAIAYDSRRNSDRFSRQVAGVLCANGIKVYLSPTIMSVPQLSFSILELKVAAGVVITASHNPPAYNGYKVYGRDGGQVDTEDAAIITKYIGLVPDMFHIEAMDLAEAKDKGLLCWMTPDLLEIYYSKVKALLVHPEMVRKEAEELNIVYTPLYGCGNVPVRRILKDIGIKKLHVVPEQENPNPDFPGLAAPNPEDPNAFTMAIKLADQVKANLILATDPDSDRLGVAVRIQDGSFKLLTGNQIGCLLADYTLTQTPLKGNEYIIKSIVSTSLADAIAQRAGADIKAVYTGFKFFAEQIKLTEQEGREKFLFGFEESYGFLKGTFVRDKDAIIASMMVCEAACYYNSKGMTLWDAVGGLYEKYGYYQELVISKTLKGMEGLQKIAEAMVRMRANPITEISSMQVTALRDYLNLTCTNSAGSQTQIHMNGNVKSNVLYCELEKGWFVLRPSGTEPKIKSYISYKGETLAEAQDG
ncbi:MAG: phospho-sugar mutase, partial [Eubacteriales bacterium]